MALREHEFSTVSDVVSHLLGTASDSPRWYRGHGCGSFTLRPSLYRRLKDPSPQRILQVEERLILRYRQRSLPWWPEGYPQTDWEHLFAMQHYGVPTRLLDWSENALSGLYFAGDHNPAACPSCDGECRPTMWVLDPLRLNELNPRRDGMESVILTSANAQDWSPRVSSTLFAPMPVAIYGTHNSVRIAAQQGTFTVAGKDTTALEQAELGAKDGVLERITLNVSHSELLKSLRVLGVTKASVYPGLPGLAHDITHEEVF